MALVEGDEDRHDKAVKVLQDILEIVTNDMMLKGSRTLNALNVDRETEAESAKLFSHVVPELFASKHSIHFPLPDSNPLNEQIKRFLMLLTIEDTALDIPSNLEARRRITFFCHLSVYGHTYCSKSA